MSALWNVSVRLRLTLWYLVAMATIVTLYAIGVFAFVRGNLRAGLDERLHDDFELAETLVEPGADGRLSWPAGNHIEDHALDGRAIEVWEGGQLLLRVPKDADVVATSVQPVNPVVEYRYASEKRADGTQLRTLTGHLRMQGAPRLIMRVSRSDEPIRGELRSLGLVLAFAWPAALALAGGGGYLVSRRALAPVDHMAQHARRITADRLHERLPVDTPNDELGRLATVFNETLARLDDAFARLKRFTADASHELRTPLTAIRSVGEVALREHRTEGAYRDAIGSMLEEVDRLTRLVETLLLLSRADGGRGPLVPESLDLDQLAREVCAHLAVLAEERRLTLLVNGRSGVTVNADRQLLRSALVNVVDNAVKYSPEGTAVTIVVADGPDSTISVTDTGPGIPAAQQPHLFDRFYRVDRGRARQHGGSGLGLAIAKWAVEANGGRIELESSEGVGSSFTIVLPGSSSNL